MKAESVKAESEQSESESDGESENDESKSPHEVNPALRRENPYREAQARDDNGQLAVQSGGAADDDDSSNYEDDRKPAAKRDAASNDAESTAAKKQKTWTKPEAGWPKPCPRCGAMPIPKGPIWSRHYYGHKNNKLTQCGEHVING